MLKFFRSPHTKEHTFMAPKISALTHRPHSFAKLALIGIGCLIILFLIVASFAQIHVEILGMGQVIPSQKDQIISNLEGGIIKSVLVKEGDLVEKGQVLMTIDPTDATAEFKTHRENYLRLFATSERLQSQIDGKDFKVPEEVQKEAPLIGKEEMTHYQERRKEVEIQLDIQKKIILEKQGDLAEEKAKVTQAQNQLTLSEKELNMVLPLVADHLISKREILRLRRDKANLEGEIATGEAAVADDQAILEQAQYNLKEVQTKFENEDQDLLLNIKQNLDEERAKLAESQDRMKRTEIRSPVEGIVKDIRMKTIGGVVRGGEEIMEVVPYEGTLLIEAKIRPRDISFLHLGQKAIAKFTAYDYTIYGSLNAELIEISPDTIHDPLQRRDFYRVLLRTDKNYLNYKGKKLPIIPGMIAEADIFIGSRTVMEYLLKPLMRGSSQSFTPQ